MNRADAYVCGPRLNRRLIDRSLESRLAQAHRQHLVVVDDQANAEPVDVAAIEATPRRQSPTLIEILAAIERSREEPSLLVTTAEAARLLSMSPDFIKALIRNRHIDTVPLGRAVRIPRTEVLRIAIEGIQ